MSQLNCGDVTVSETDEISTNDVSLSDCSLSSSSVTATETLRASVNATNTLQATPLGVTIALTAPRAAGDLPTVTATLDPGEQVRVEVEITGNALGVSSEPFAIGWEVVSAEPGATIPDPIDPGDPGGPILEPTDPGFTTEPIQLESPRFR